MTDTSSASQPNKLTDAQFAEARELYETDAMSLADIAAKFDISRQALSQRFKTNNVVKGSRKAKTATQLAAEEAAKLEAANAERFESKRPGWIEETRVEGYKGLKLVQQLTRKLVMDEVKAAQTAGTQPRYEGIDADLRAMGRFSKIMADSTQAMLNVLKADDFMDEQDLPMLEISDLTQEDILKHHINTGAFDEETTIEEMLEEERAMGRTHGME